MRVLKFGGSSLASPARVREVARIILEERRREPIIVVVSAFQGVTNQLVDCARLAERGDSTSERPCRTSRAATGRQSLGWLDGGVMSKPKPSGF